MSMRSFRAAICCCRSLTLELFLFFLFFLFFFSSFLPPLLPPSLPAGSNVHWATSTHALHTYAPYTSLPLSLSLSVACGQSGQSYRFIRSCLRTLIKHGTHIFMEHTFSCAPLLTFTLIYLLLLSSPSVSISIHRWRRCGGWGGQRLGLPIPGPGPVPRGRRCVSQIQAQHRRVQRRHGFRHAHQFESKQQ
jgi:hypothetical protein